MHIATPNRKILMTAALAGLFTVSTIGPIHAEPPPWAPAHGYRAKYAGRHHDDHEIYFVPRGIPTGRCYRGIIDGRSAGALLGGVAGGVVGSNVGDGDGRVAATIGGTLLGVLIGSEIGAAMDLADQYCVAKTLEYADTNAAVRWQNPDAEARYEVRPTRTYEAGDGRYCREFQTTATIGGRVEELHGTACRQPDGAWQRLG